MKVPQTLRASHQITSMTETYAISTFKKVKKAVKNESKIKAFRDAIIAYVENSSSINWEARAGKITTQVKQLDETLREMQKVRVAMAAGKKDGKIKIAPIPNVRITYRLNSYDPKIHHLIPFNNYNKKNAERVKLNHVIVDKAFLSTSANRQYLSDPYDPISQSQLPTDRILVKMVMLGYTGTPIGIEGIKTSNDKFKKNHIKQYRDAAREEGLKGGLEEKEIKRKEDLSEAKALEIQIRAGEGEVLYGRGTKWRVKKIDRSELSKKYDGKNYRSVYVCLEQVDPSPARDLQSSFDGTAVNMDSKSSNDFTDLWKGTKTRVPIT